MASSGDIKAGSAFVEIAAKDSALQIGLKNAQKKVEAFGKSVTSVGKSLSLIGASIAAPLGIAVTKFAAAGDALDEMSVKTGIATESLSALQYAASFSSIDLDKLGSSVAKMQRNLAGGSKAFDRLGLSVEDLLKLTPEQQLGKIADAINAIENPAQKTAAAMDIFGRSGQELLPFLAEGSVGIKRLTDEAASMGLVLSGKAAKSAAALDDALTKLSTGVGAIGNSIASVLAPVLVDIATKIQALLPGVIQWIQDNQSVVLGVTALGAILIVAGGAAIAFGAAISGVGAIIGVVSGALSVFGTIAAGVSAAIAIVGAPVAIVVAGLAALAAYFLVGTDTGRTFLGYIGSAFVTTFNAISGVVQRVVGFVIDKLGSLWSTIRPILESLGIISEATANTEQPGAAAPGAVPPASPAATTTPQTAEMKKAQEEAQAKIKAAVDAQLATNAPQVQGLQNAAQQGAAAASAIAPSTGPAAGGGTAAAVKGEQGEVVKRLDLVIQIMRQAIADMGDGGAVFG